MDIKVVNEGNVKALLYTTVFYNPVQEFNRDLSVLVLNVYFRRLAKERREKEKKKKKLPEEEDKQNIEEAPQCYEPGKKYTNGMRILEALAATGLRSVRYAKEVAGVHTIVANDMSEMAVKLIKENVRLNEVEHLIESSQSNAMTVMYNCTTPKKCFDAIDLDPYGCPSRFLDGAIQSIADGGLLLVTATDMAVLAGNAPEACYVKYGSAPLRMKSCHEMALRILLHTIESHANRYGKYVQPLLSISADFYVRVFVRIFTSQQNCKYSMSKQSMIFQCTGCATYTLHQLGSVSKSASGGVKFGVTTGPPVGMRCEHCGQKHHIGGPIWSHPIHDTTFVEELLQEKNLLDTKTTTLGTARRIYGVLSVVREELPDVPLYYTLDKLCCVLKLEIMPVLKFRSALLHAGYRVSFSHAYKNSIKTNAPASVLWDILRCWNKRHPVNEKRMLDGTPVKEILSKPCINNYIFDDIHQLANPESRKTNLSRYQENPTMHWGPGRRDTTMVGENGGDKRIRNQNKKQKQKIKVLATDDSAQQLSGNIKTTKQKMTRKDGNKNNTDTIIAEQAVDDADEVQCKLPKLNA